MTFILLNLFTKFLRPRMWSIFVNVSCKLEKSIYFAVVG
jgi:hypothetical protein